MPALTASRGQDIGAYYMLIAKRNSSGYAVGQVADPETISNGTTMQPLLITSIMSFTPEVPTLSKITNRGGQNIISETPMGRSSNGTATFELSEYDERLIPLINGSTLDVSTVEGWAEIGTNPDQRKFPRLCVIVGQRFTDTTTGSEQWKMRIYHNCIIEETNQGGISQADGENPNPKSFTLTPSKSTRNITGRAFSASSGLFVVNANEVVTRIRAPYALAFTTFKAAAASTTYTTGHRPVYSTATGAADNSITKNGTTFATTSVTTSTGAVVFTAGSDADMHVIVYPTEFVAI